MTETIRAAMPATIAKAIAAVMEKIGSVEKRGKNAFHNYNYATAADIMHKAQPLMAEAGLIITPFQKRMEFLEGGAAVALTFEFALSHISGETWGERPEFTGVASARNGKGGFDDKCANKCLTGALKYFTLALFKIPTGDYDDADAEEDRPPTKAATPKAAARPAAPKAKTETPFDHAVGPSLIKVAMDDEGNPDWRGWGSAFVSALGSAKTAQDVEAWCQANAAPLRNLRATQEALGKRVDERIQEAYARVGQPGGETMSEDDVNDPARYLRAG